MNTSKTELTTLFRLLKKQLQAFSNTEIEDGVMLYCLTEYSKDADSYTYKNSKKVANILSEFNLATDLETIINFFESLLDIDNINENGIVFTPKYISDYIANSLLLNLTNYTPQVLILDPSCGCGIFLISVAILIHERFNIDIDDIIRKNLYGIEIDKDNSRRCALVLKLLSAQYGGDYNHVIPNICCTDSLRCAWTDIFNVSAFNYIIGNPPYVNPHDMTKERRRFLKENFATTQTGAFNIFYAFIEHAMKYISSEGMLGYIVPNNFLSIKSALELRCFLQQYQYTHTLLDFGDNMLFSPIRTYNCILILTKKPNQTINYATIPKTSDIEEELSRIEFHQLYSVNLDKRGWNLHDERTARNITRIESQKTPIKEFIRTGIATLKDDIYLVDHDETGFFKIINGEKIWIEESLVRPIYKIPELKSHANIDDAKRYIIFPYRRENSKYVLIDEQTLRTEYPSAYLYLNLVREVLDSRDKGKPNSQGWYAYGRTQGLNKSGKKLLFPTFSNSPRFTYVDNEDALFCNGYAVFENNQYSLDTMVKVLNSSLMDYYVSNTSYTIEGGYYCYQKKYVEHFSLPLFSESEITFINNSSPDELNHFLWQRYELE